VNIAITGVSGYIGSKLLSYLDAIDDVKKIIGIDVQEPGVKSAKLKFYQHDVRQPFGDLFIENSVDTVVHLAFILFPRRDTTLVREIDIGGTKNMLAACRQAKVKHLIYLSSHTAYGAHRDNPIPLTEDCALRPIDGFQYSHDKVEIESLLDKFRASNRDITLTVLRCCPVLGANAVGTATTIMFQPFVMVGVMGCEAPMQFVHEDDLVNIIGLLIKLKKRGIYNVAGDGVVPYSEVARMLKKKLLRLPGVLLKLIIAFSWITHMQSASPASGLEFIKYPPVVSTAKLKKELGYKFQYSSKEALSALADCVNMRRDKRKYDDCQIYIH
jgi:UDP-glucose 4-epimerase